MQRDRLGAGVGGEAAALEAAYDRAELVEHRGERAVAGDVDGHTVEVVVRGERGGGVAVGDGGGEAAVGRAHPVEVVGGEPGDRLGDGETVHGDHHGVRLAHLGQVDLGDDGRATGGGADQAALTESQQRLAHGRTTHAEARGQIGVADHLAGRERALHDQVAQPVVDGVAQQGGADRGSVDRDGHAIYCTSGGGRGQGGSPVTNGRAGSVETAIRHWTTAPAATAPAATAPARRDDRPAEGNNHGG